MPDTQKRDTSSRSDVINSRPFFKVSVKARAGKTRISGEVMQMGNVGPRNRIFERREEAQMGNGREKTSTPVLVPPAGRKEGSFKRRE